MPEDRKTMLDELQQLGQEFKGTEAKPPQSFDDIPEATYETVPTDYRIRRIVPKDAVDKKTDYLVSVSVFCKIKEGQESAGRMLFPSWIIHDNREGADKARSQEAVSRLMGALEAVGLQWDPSEAPALLGCLDSFVEAEPTIVIRHQKRKEKEGFNDYVNKVLPAGATDVAAPVAAEI